MRLVLVRHGRTAWHSEERHVGQTDVPLDEEGLSQAVLVADRVAGMEIDAVFSSPLSRCLVIANIITDHLGLPVKVDDRLREMDVGGWSGKNYSTVTEQHGNIVEQWMKDPGSLIPPGGESLAEVRERTMSWFEDAWERHTWQNVLACSHSTPIRFLVSELMGLPASLMYRFDVGFASVTTLTWNGKHAHLEVLNDTCHLES